MAHKWQTGPSVDSHNHVLQYFTRQKIQKKIAKILTRQMDLTADNWQTGPAINSQKHKTNCMKIMKY